jgi:hypothetical protein
MLTLVKYHTGDCELVRTDHIDELIATAQIKQFLRLEGWATVGCDPLRVRENERPFQERRQQFKLCHTEKILHIKLNI